MASVLRFVENSRVLFFVPRQFAGLSGTRMQARSIASGQLGLKQVLGLLGS